MKTFVFFVIVLIIADSSFCQDIQNTIPIKYEHVPNSKILAYKSDEFQIDSIQYDKLKIGKDLIESSIKNRVDSLKNVFKKDAFETTEQFNIRYKKREQVITSALKNELDFIKNELNWIGEKIYRFPRKNGLKINLDSSKYDADLGKWKIAILMNQTIQFTELSLNPEEAKTLWFERATIEFNTIRNIQNSNPEFLEVKFGRNKEKTILFTIQSEKSLNKNLVKEYAKYIYNNDKVFENVETEAEFPDGKSAWISFLNKKIDDEYDYLREHGGFGDITIEFTINEDGKIGKIESIPCIDSKNKKCPSNSTLADFAMKTILNGPSWEAATLYGEKVKTYKRVEISSHPKGKDSIEIDAEFPGGASGWTTYINKEIERNIAELSDDGRSGTVVVLFVVDKEGGVSEVRALSCSEAGVGNCLPPDSKLASIAVNAVKKGPKWIPAVQYGRNVKAYRRQPVTFQMTEE